ncbi:MAG: hypothetical protein HY343_12205 [Lentisphaerae bacterium]|nr:hypothetical protein [Lentisphaerota bacterium]
MSRFVFYGDCCSGIPGGPYERHFARVNAGLRRLKPPPDFIVFLGDHIMGNPAHADRLRQQWRYWLDKEMGWLAPLQIPIFHVTSNHNTFNRISERVWREVFPDIPRQAPPGQEGLSYWVRRGDLLLVVVNTSFSGLGGHGHVESAWLDTVLTKHSDARYRIVAGHHPVFPVNGYDERPLWCIARGEAERFWSVLARHRVLAYLCSHIIAFDVQDHDGVLQICSGGAGTNYGPGGFMGKGEYHHFVQATLTPDAFRLKTVDIHGKTRERFTRSLSGVARPANPPRASCRCG